MRNLCAPWRRRVPMEAPSPEGASAPLLGLMEWHFRFQDLGDERVIGVEEDDRFGVLFCLANCRSTGARESLLQELAAEGHRVERRGRKGLWLGRTAPTRIATELDFARAEGDSG